MADEEVTATTPLRQRLTDAALRALRPPATGRLVVRARPRSFGGFSMGCQPAHEQLDDGDDGHGGRGVDQALEVLGEAAVAAEPGEGALDHPAPWQQVEAGGVARPPDDLELQSLARGGVQSDIAMIAGIGEQVTEPGKAP